MNELEDYEPPKTHSIVSCEDGNACELRPNHIGMPVTYKGVTGWLIRYVTTCEHNLLSLSLDEVRECLEVNAPVDTDI